MRYFLPFPVLLLIHLTAIAQSDCRFNEYKQELLRNSPGLSTRVQEIESFTRTQLQHRGGMTTTGSGNTLHGDGATMPAGGHSIDAQSVITIPVVVHIVYNSAAENISDAQVGSQLAVLNRDYRKLNADTTGIPGCYRSRAADCGFRFALANVDVNGVATSGILRKHTTIQAFGVNDDMKYATKGGDDAWDRDSYLNIWVVNLTNGILGYSSVVGGPKDTDGVTILYTAFGTTGTAAAPFNLGRTATHEIGHWLNMIHTWGDADCGTDDVDDTPQQEAATRGNPSGIVVSCGNAPFGNMYMDYMDFTDDIGMHMFTNGQRDRMRTLFTEGGFRYPLLSSTAVTTTPVSTTTPPISGTTGDSSQSLSLYPNPAVSGVSVTMTDGSSIGSIMDVYNQTGQKIMSVRITQQSFQLNVSSLSKGMYFIRINGGKQKSIFKLVKI
jgi:hypothetical protein